MAYDRIADELRMKLQAIERDNMAAERARIEREGAERRAEEEREKERERYRQRIEDEERRRRNR